MKTWYLTKGFIAIVAALFVMNSPALGQWELAGNKVFTPSTAYHVGIGTGETMSFYKKLHVKGAYSTSAATYGVYVDVLNTYGYAGHVYGAYIVAESRHEEDDDNVYGIYSKAKGDYEDAYVSNIYGGYFETVGTNYDHANYGLYVRNGSSGANAYGIYVYGGRENYFQKMVGIGMYPAKTLDVNGTTRTKVIEITGGADLAEPFEVVGTEAIQPGMVVCIDPEQAGQLRLSSRAYDHTVAGIVSGAGGIQPGIVLSSSESEQETTGKYPLALTGRVYAWADASEGPIQPGDLLTTSNTPGHAMKVYDYTKAQGTTIGKVMSSLDEGRGLVLVLVALQ